jgi:RNA polymerase sigma-70 factor, ECF subfamily
VQPDIGGAGAYRLPATRVAYHPTRPHTCWKPPSSRHRLGKRNSRLESAYLCDRLRVVTDEWEQRLDNGLQLMQRAQRWDEGALAEIYDVYAPSIYRYVYRKTGSVETAQDLTGETFRRLLEALRRDVGPREHLSGWLHRVAHNLVVDHYRRLPDGQMASLDDVELTMAAAQESLPSGDGRIERARAALNMLTPLQQQVLNLRYLEGLSLNDVAVVLNRTVGSVKALQHRAISTMQSILEEVE